MLGRTRGGGGGDAKLCPQPGSFFSDHMSGFGGEIADEILLHLNI